MGLLDQNSIFSSTTPTFDLGANSTIQQNSLLGIDQDLDGGEGSQFDLGTDSTIQQNSLLSLGSGLGGNSGPLFDLGLSSMLQNNLLLQIPGEVQNSPYLNLDENSGLSSDLSPNSTLSLNGESGPTFDLNKDSTLQQDSLLSIPDPTSPQQSPYQDLDGLKGPKFDTFYPGQEPGQDPENPQFDTIHEQSLLAPKKRDLDLNGEKGIFQTSLNIRDKANRMSLNSVPGGMTPSQFADLNGTNIVNTDVPGGAPNPNNNLFTQRNGIGLDRPVREQGHQVGGVDLHTHLLTTGYINKQGNLSTSKTGGQLDLNGNTPVSYRNTMNESITGLNL